MGLPSESGHTATGPQTLQGLSLDQPVAEGNKARLEVLLEPDFILLLSFLDAQSTFSGHCADDRHSEIGSWVWSHWCLGLP